MADFKIPCATFVRLASIVEGYQPSPERAELLSVNIRHTDGKIIAAATNSHVAVFEFLGKTDQPDDMVMVIPDAALVQQCKNEAAFGGSLTVQTNDILRFATAKTALGYNHPTNAAIWGSVPGDMISRLIKIAASFEQPKKSSKIMHWYFEGIAKLAGASPSGRILFPKFFDASKPVILRDPIDQNWLGLFIPQMSPKDAKTEQYNPAAVPDWIKE